LYTLIDNTENGFLSFVFWFQPWKNFGQAFAIILGAVGERLGSTTNASSSSALLLMFTWEDASRCLDPKTKLPVNDPTLCPATVSGCIGQLWLMAFSFLVMAWYFGQVVSDGTGAGQAWTFVFSKGYWTGKQAGGPAAEAGDTIARELELSEQHDSVRTHKVSKSYAKVTALKEVTLAMEPGQITALLGQNGAGKSTLVKVLSGLTDATHGAVFAFGLDIHSDMDQLRANMGSCAQDDTLWGELTAREQLRICCALKGVPKHDVTAEVELRLEQVSLTSRGDSRVGGFSGGMKRRLSVAMAAVNSPKLVFLDEPTTGMVRGRCMQI
jgi:ATP-binding cassette subfamily A (ABC1) protein 3